MAHDLWTLALSRRGDHVFSTLFAAQSVAEYLNTDAGIAAALDWCRQQGITKVYLESFRDGQLAKQETLTRARDQFRAAGLEVSGCVTTTGMAKSSEVGPDLFPCFTDPDSQQQLADIFAFTAALFDEIMIDDFYCTACQCAACEQARGERSWAEYRVSLMHQVSRERVLAPARRANPKVQVIIKYPNWYEEFQDRGYDPGPQADLFERTWAGTETRDMDDPGWGGIATYRAFWLMRWLEQLGGGKCGGGWYDPYGTHADTFLEQARQTLLGGARESLLFCHPSLLVDTGPENLTALRGELAGLLDLAQWVAGHTPRGVVSYKPVGSPGGDESYVFDWLGLLGIPVVPTHLFPEQARSVFFSAHAAHDPDFAARSAALLAAGGHAVLTRRAAAAAAHPRAFLLEVPARPQQLLDLPAEALAALRRAALAPLGLALEGPTSVALYLLGERKVALESFRAEPCELRLTLPQADRYRLALTLGREGAAVTSSHGALSISLPPRTLVCLER